MTGMNGSELKSTLFFFIPSPYTFADLPPSLINFGVINFGVIRGETTEIAEGRANLSIQGIDIPKWY